MKNSKYESHGLYKSPEYRAWYYMKDRCYNQNDKSYHRYGGRGITVCARWLYSFNNFYEDMGTRPSLGAQLDREENKGDYKPGNCRWVIEQ